MTKWMAHKRVIFVAHNMSGYDGQFILKKASNKSALELVYEEEAEKVVEKSILISELLKIIEAKRPVEERAEDAAVGGGAAEVAREEYLPEAQREKDPVQERKDVEIIDRPEARMAHVQLALWPACWNPSKPPIGPG
ncbi:hypothetical protein L5515_018897 [Caenorhabditis briggsae]|uniref:Uncharacterized protein n=1 Tax=Caenorhabditis briggsae TaxID=6238 RepID=A0AAE9FIC1_CAEBR|nr:hypothetical protein L5515_018897 [Caenorhabditis briggsae]